MRRNLRTRLLARCVEDPVAETRNVGGRLKGTSVLLPIPGSPDRRTTLG